MVLATTKHSANAKLHERVMAAAQMLKHNGYADVVPILMRNQAQILRADRKPRVRGVKVKLLGGKVNAVLDEARVLELLER